ncbi:MAG: ATP-dependent DNA helicase RecG [Patescibacteria group bacterium]
MKLSSPVSELSLVGPYYQKKLSKLGIVTVLDLINHIPHRYIDFSQTFSISKVKVGDILTVKGKVKSVKNQYTRTVRKIQVAEIEDSTGSISAVWFNQPYLINTLNEGDVVSLSGKIDWFGRKVAFISPEYEKNVTGKVGLHTGRLVPIYPETSGLSSKWLRGRIKEAIISLSGEIVEILPNEVLNKHDLTELKDSYYFVHFPENLKQAEDGRKRLAFDELLYLHIASLRRKLDWQKNDSTFDLKIDKKAVDTFIKNLNFKLTNSQKGIVDEIFSDFSKKYPMNRLLEGDVGSGKTVVAAIGTFISFINGYQTVFMAPTQILAQQHYNTLKELFEPFKARISLLTSGQVKKDLGKEDIFVGTHSLINKNALFDKVSLVVIDEQQKFGVDQREKLVKKAKNKKVSPHVLNLTATPIPRTVALTLYGDLDLSTLKELPPGRKPITTWLVPPAKREGAYKWIQENIEKEKVQVYIVCPLIEESEKETMQTVKSAKSEFEKLKKVFPNLSLDLMHGKLKSKEKEDIIERFKKGKTDILVSTPVVEVGIDVGNATIMVIEAAERFGLSSLHQLRGRVGRGNKKSYCLLFTENKNEKVTTRLSAMQKNLNGFELAELDLRLRGPGEVFGTKQHGFPELKIASWQDISLIKKTKEVAQDVIKNPNEYKELIKIIDARSKITN